MSLSGCSSTPVGLHSLMDFCKEKDKGKIEKEFINLNLKIPPEDNGGHTGKDWKEQDLHS